MSEKPYTYVYAVISGPSSSRTHAIAASALPFDLELHSPLCGTHFKSQPMVARMHIVMCTRCKRRMDEMEQRGAIIRWVGEEPIANDDRRFGDGLEEVVGEPDGRHNHH